MLYIRLFAAMLLACFASIAPTTRADSPPDLPLPPCTLVAGVFYGACVTESDVLDGAAAGRFAAGATLLVQTIPSIPVCDVMSTYTWEWSPSNCYSAVAAPRIVTCATIDLTNDQKFRELPCATALFRSTQGLPSQLFTMTPPEGGVCGDRPDYITWAYGSGSWDTIWSKRGPKALECKVTFAAPRRPDGLYGPTWVKIQVQINVGRNGEPPLGRTEMQDFYVPIDGDMRTTPDVEVSGSATLSNDDWANGRLLATYKVKLENRSTTKMENVKLIAGFPSFLMAQSVSTSNCKLPSDTGEAAPGPDSFLKTGGPIQCEWPILAAESSINLDFVVRILNATDFDAMQNGTTLSTYTADKFAGVELTASATNDQNNKNDKATVKLAIPFRSGSYEQTDALMASIAPYFNYKTDILDDACSTYKQDIYTRLDAIRTAHPEAFAQLSFGDVTSGDYDIPGWTSVTGQPGGHVGVVVYEKGTNYRQTGIIINGTPSPSPLNFNSQIGANGLENFDAKLTWTASHGYYFRTHANKFPGMPQQEAKRGFEGKYGNNVQEFTFGGAVPPLAAPSEQLSCPIAPEAVTIRTESPVDIIATNSRGQRIETKDGMLVVQELDTGIVSMAFPHDDGTYAWHLTLPVDDYKVQLRGTGSGPYRLTTTTFAKDGTPTETVTSGTTAVGQMDEYKIEKPADATPTTPTTPTAPTTSAPAASSASGGKGGGGGFDVVTLLLAAAFVIAGRRARLDR